MAMGNTTVDPKKYTANICCSNIIVNSQRELNSGNNGKYKITQGESLVIQLSSLEGYKINDSGELIGPDGTKTNSVVSRDNENRYREYRRLGKNNKKEEKDRD